MTHESHQSEYDDATQRAGFFLLDGWSTIRTTGGDRASFLHNLCTNEIRSLAVGQGCEAFFTDVKGKIVGHAFLLAGEEAIEMITVPQQAPRLIAHLDRYVIREDVRLADMTEKSAWTLVVGPMATSIVDQIAGDGASDLVAPLSHRQRQIGGVPARIVRCGLVWCSGLLVGSAADDLPVVLEKLASAGAASCDASIWHTIRIESGWPLFGVDFDGSNLPQEVGRDALAISFQKGCYLGQETIARIDALGHVNKRLTMAKLGGSVPPAVGADFSAGDQLVGHVTSACWSPRERSALAMGMIRRGFGEPGIQLTCAGEQAVVISIH